MSGDRVNITADESLLGSDEEQPRIGLAGKRRVVRFIPVPLPGTKGVMRPSIWTSPHVMLDHRIGRKVKSHVVLLRRGPPVDVAVINVIEDDLSNCPMGLVECEEIRGPEQVDPFRGETRNVPMFPLPGGLLYPCIWMSPYEVADDDLRQRVRVCVVLTSAGPLKPDVISLRVPSSAVDKFMTGSVEW